MCIYIVCVYIYIISPSNFFFTSIVRQDLIFLEDILVFKNVIIAEVYQL